MTTAGADTEAATLLDLFASSAAVLTERPENADYLGGLSSLPLSELLATPTTLSTQSHTLTASLNALAHTSYPAILSLHNTSSALLGSLSSLDTSLNALLDTALPALDDAARTFREKSGPTVIEERQRTRVVLEQYDKLRDLLDVPVLMDTCVRNGLYAEALALAGHATTALSALSTLRAQGGGGGERPPEADGRPVPLPLVSALQAEIASSLNAMRLLLLGTLREPGRKLPAFWKAVQFLRRMQVLPESELALAFVSARIHCLRSALQAVERDAGVSITIFSDDGDNITGSSTADREKEMDRRAEDVARFLKKYTDVWREGAYDLVTQYATMFLERASAQGSASSHLAATTSFPDPVIRHTLPSTLLGLLLPTIKTYLRRAYPHLAPLATQLAYCSSAMARIGMDFRSLLSPLITHAVTDGFARDIKIGAEREWSIVIAKHASGAKPTPPTQWLVPPPSLSLASPSAQSSLPTPSALSLPPTSMVAVHVPPQVLTAFPPLAVSLNTHLRALNRLRALAPMGALRGVLDTLEASLARDGAALLEYARAWTDRDDGGGGAAERVVVRAVGMAYVRVLVPFLRRAVVEGVFGMAYDTLDDVSRRGGAAAVAEEEEEEEEEETGVGRAGSDVGSGLLRDTVRGWGAWLSGVS